MPKATCYIDITEADDVAKRLRHRVELLDLGIITRIEAGPETCRFWYEFEAETEADRDQKNGRIMDALTSLAFDNLQLSEPMKRFTDSLRTGNLN